MNKRSQQVHNEDLKKNHRKVFFLLFIMSLLIFLTLYFLKKTATTPTQKQVLNSSDITAKNSNHNPVLQATQIVSGDSKGIILANGDFLIIAEEPAGHISLFRSIDNGTTLKYENIIMEGHWAGAYADGNVVYVTAGRRGSPNSINFKKSTDGGHVFDSEIQITSSDNLLIDTAIIKIFNGDLLLFFTEIEGDVGAGIYTIHVYQSADNGNSWSFLSDVISGPFKINIEDTRLMQLRNNDILVLYEYEEEENGTSHLEQKRSIDMGATWGEASTIWDDGMNVDIEPGGYLDISENEIWLLASTDEDDAPKYGSYTAAKVKYKVSSDIGRTWKNSIMLLDFTDNISFGAVKLTSGNIKLISIRFWDSGTKKLSIYSFDAQ